MFITICCAVVIYMTAKAFYRLVLHPLTSFPGTKLASGPSLCGASWDLPLKTSFIKETAKWHNNYGQYFSLPPGIELTLKRRTTIMQATVVEPSPRLNPGARFTGDGRNFHSR